MSTTQIVSYPPALNSSGSVVISTGSSMTPQPCVLVTSSATQVLAAGSRNKATLVNLGNSVVYISGTNGVAPAINPQPTAGTTTIGIPLQPGGIYEWTNTGTIYGITDTGAAASIIGINTE